MFKAPFSFNGRIRRLEYGLTIIIYYLVIFVLSAVMEEVEDIMPLLSLMTILIALIWFMLAQGAKRCHDRNVSGWYQIIPFYVFVLLFGEGDAGSNRFGPNPKTGEEYMPEEAEETAVIEETPVAE